MMTPPAERVSRINCAQRRCLCPMCAMNRTSDHPGESSAKKPAPGRGADNTRRSRLSPRKETSGPSTTAKRTLRTRKRRAIRSMADTPAAYGTSHGRRPHTPSAAAMISHS